jgi:beta-lactamase class A
VSRLSALREAAAREARRFDGKLGIYVMRLGLDGCVGVHADEPFPLASVFKLGVLVELFRRVDAGEIQLDQRRTVRPEDMSPGGVILEFLEAGIRPTVRDLAELMIIVSDNTATDLLFKKVGLRSVNPTMRSLGLSSLDIFCPNREWFLLLLGYSPRFRGTDAAALLRRWDSLDAEGRLREMEWLWRHGNRVHLETMKARLRAWERSGRMRGRPWRLWEEATDNRGSPADVGRLLDLIARGKAASRPSCRTMIHILEDQQYHRLSLGLAQGTRIASKTGSITGVVNDAGVVFPRSRPPFVVVCLSRDLTPRQEADAPEAIARVARAAWRAWGDP